MRPGGGPETQMKLVRRSAAIVGLIPQCVHGNAQHIHHLITMLAKSLSQVAVAENLELQVSCEAKQNGDAEMLLSFLLSRPTVMRPCASLDQPYRGVHHTPHSAVWGRIGPDSGLPAGNGTGRQSAHWRQPRTERARAVLIAPAASHRGRKTKPGRLRLTRRICSPPIPARPHLQIIAGALHSFHRVVARVARCDGKLENVCSTGRNFCSPVCRACAVQLSLVSRMPVTGAGASDR
jgi:hypothetical protein